MLRDQSMRCWVAERHDMTTTETERFLAEIIAAQTAAGPIITRRQLTLMAPLCVKTRQRRQS